MMRHLLSTRPAGRAGPAPPASGPPCRVRLASGRSIGGRPVPRGRRAIHLGLLTEGLVDLTPGAWRADGARAIDRRARPAQYPPGRRSGGVHARRKLNRPLATSGAEAADTGVAIECGHQHATRAPGVDASGRGEIADPDAVNRARLMRLAGIVDCTSGAYARVQDADRRARALPGSGPPRRPAAGADHRAPAATATGGRLSSGVAPSIAGDRS
jgi:hypothetical protein